MSYTVVRGDTLGSIAAKLGISLSALETANPMSNFNKIGVGQVLNVPGKGTAAPAPAGAAPAADPNLQTALSAYGAVGVFAQSNPQVAGILNQAVAEQWDAARFQRALWGTDWWKSFNESQRQLQVLQATDPQAYNAQLAEKSNEVSDLATGLGLTGFDANNLALQALSFGWSTAVLQQHLVDSSRPRTVNGQATGSLGDYQNQVRQTFSSYGLQFSDEWYTMVAHEIAAGRQTTGGMQNEAIGYASSLYPQYTEAFKQGKTLSDIAQPFLQQMQQTLEVDPANVTLTDPTIQRALQGDGKAPTPLWQFTQQLKQDPRWQQTTNAKNDAYDMLAKIGQDWGFVK